MIFVRSVASVSLLFVLAAVSARAQTSRTCNPRGSSTVAENAQVRVYSVPNRYGTGREVRACFYRRGESHELGTRDVGLDGGSYVAPVILTRSIVAWEESFFDHYDNHGYDIRVLNLATHRLLHSAAQIGDGSGAEQRAWTVRGFVVDRAGSVAWIATGRQKYDLSQSYQPVIYQVFKSDTSRGAQLLDEGTKIGAQSLRRHGKTISWREAGETRSARFMR
jgi:hypothetical protein